MSNNLFTPGPWLIDQGSFVYALNENGTNVFWAHVQPGSHADGYRKFTDTPKAEVEANARLIAAAPELLEALEWAMSSGRFNYVQRTSSNSGFCDSVDKARAAIAKARGEA